MTDLTTEQALERLHEILRNSSELETRDSSIGGIVDIHTIDFETVKALDKEGFISDNYIACDERNITKLINKYGGYTFSGWMYSSTRARESDTVLVVIDQIYKGSSSPISDEEAEEFERLFDFCGYLIINENCLCANCH